MSEWRKTINDLITRYFANFASQKFKLTVKRSEINLNGLQVDTSLLKINWLDESTVELVGMRSEIDKCIKQIMPLGVIKTDANEKKAAPSAANAMPTSTKKSTTKSPNPPLDSFGSTLSGSVKSKENNDFDTELKNSQNQENFLISDLKWFQTRILFEKKYFQYVAETFKDLSVLLDTQLTRLFFTGPKKQEIELAKKLAFEILDQIMGAEMDCDEETLKKMTANENSYSNLLKKNGLCCVVDTKSSTDKYTIYATTLEEIDACKNLLLQIEF